MMIPELTRILSAFDRRFSVAMHDGYVEIVEDRKHIAYVYPDGHVTFRVDQFGCGVHREDERTP